MDLGDHNLVVKDNFVLFWGSPFSQWYKSKFTIEETTYNCAEQYMMQQKALMFNDKETADKIMNTSDPRQQKMLGRSVKIDPEEWDLKSFNVVFRGNIYKFSQNEKLKEILLATEDMTIVEASPYDVVWGIGLDADDPDAVIPANWKGKNKLGKVLMDVRSYFKVIKNEIRI